MEKLHEKCVFFNHKKTSLARTAVERHLGLKSYLDQSIMMQVSQI